MPEYRRLRVPGGCYFFTVALANRHSSLLVDHVALLRASVVRVRSLLPFEIDAFVVLPEHLHAIWTLPAEDDDYPRRWCAIKALFSRGLSKGEPVGPSRRMRGERGIWQRRYWEHTIRDDRDYAAHIDYVHFNPVKHGLVGHVADWRYSSFHRSVARGIYPPDWAWPDHASQCGEP